MGDEVAGLALPPLDEDPLERQALLLGLRERLVEPGAGDRSGVGEELEERVVRALEGHGSGQRLTLTLIICTGVVGRSSRSTLVLPIFLTTSMPLMTFPKTGCLLGSGVNQSR